ncbi:50S ribosomal protein L2 [Candidatus Mycoplasma haematolamae str. Purdue]|uniref:Large ribosomal subunit protein uL2 n=1 Tax=Mycoplasma haematolamae (strain Purdue) TaxID=1212765 RepID=I7BA41_MYCHA|nr:50S ribosomal protein L2 [Candidatus Mycoplasma haematolamae]AFO52155.1 50S ribosomal protein L2 [Candidatus Mycoplasma haematolamae str. Purdue]
MAIKQTVPRSSGKRVILTIDYAKILTKDYKPYKPLLTPLKKHSGRNSSGRITVRHKGGRNKRMYRIIDVKRDKLDVLGKIKTIEYDPNRTCFISLVSYVDGEKRYILTPEGVKEGDTVISSLKRTTLKKGDCMPIGVIPEGMFVHNVELKPGAGGKLVRSAGTQAQILGKDLTGKYTIIKLPSKETRKIINEAKATLGQLSAVDHNLVRLGKAGRNRQLGVRPTVRGVAMNPNDHIHGGGEGRCSIGRDAPRTPWGKRHMGVKTRARKSYSNRMIVQRRTAKN